MTGIKTNLVIVMLLWSLVYPVLRQLNISMHFILGQLIFAGPFGSLTSFLSNFEGAWTGNRGHGQESKQTYKLHYEKVRRAAEKIDTKLNVYDIYTALESPALAIVQHL